MATRRAALLLAAFCFIAACAGPGGAAGRADRPTGLQGHLLVIGGGLDDDNRPVYERLIELARAGSHSDAAHIVIATAASANQEEGASGKSQSILAYCPTCTIDVITRESTADETVAKIDAAGGMFFTGGDQKRITDRYLTDGNDTPESNAMRRLLMRGGVIAGTSAGDAMMSDPMFLTGRSAEALGIRSNRTSRGPDDDEAEKRPDPPLGPQIGKGMGFVPWVITDSHFFERNRFGRLVAALEQSGTRLGLGVGEDACVDIDLATGRVTGISVADSLLVDTGAVARDGLVRHGIRATVIRQGSTFSLPALLGADAGQIPPTPSGIEEVAVVEPGQNRQLASWRFFLRAQNSETPTAVRLSLDGYDQTAWPAGDGWSIVTIRPLAEAPSGGTADRVR